MVSFYELFVQIPKKEKKKKKKVVFVFKETQKNWVEVAPIERTKHRWKHYIFSTMDSRNVVVCDNGTGVITFLCYRSIILLISILLPFSRFVNTCLVNYVCFRAEYFDFASWSGLLVLVFGIY